MQYHVGPLKESHSFLFVFFSRFSLFRIFRILVFCRLFFFRFFLNFSNLVLFRYFSDCSVLCRCVLRTSSQVCRFFFFCFFCRCILRINSQNFIRPVFFPGLCRGVLLVGSRNFVFFSKRFPFCFPSTFLDPYENTQSVPCASAQHTPLLQIILTPAYFENSKACESHTMRWGMLMQWGMLFSCMQPEKMCVNHAFSDHAF